LIIYLLTNIQYLPAGKQTGILTYFQIKVNKKEKKTQDARPKTKDQEKVRCSILDTGCLILEKSFTAEGAEDFWTG